MSAMAFRGNCENWACGTIWKLWLKCWCQADIECRSQVDYGLGDNVEIQFKCWLSRSLS